MTGTLLCLSDWDEGTLVMTVALIASLESSLAVQLPPCRDREMPGPLQGQPGHSAWLVTVL